MFRSIIGRYGHSYGSSRLTGSAPRPTLCQTRSFVDPQCPAHLEQHHLDHQQNHQRPPGYHREFAPLLSHFYAIRSTQSTVVSPGDHVEAQKKEVPNGLKNEFFSIVRDGQPDLVMNALLDPKFEVLVGSLPESTFVEAFRLLSPAYFTDPFRAIYRALHPSAVALKGYPQLDRIFDKFACNLASIVSIRRSAGHTLGLAEYTHLLDCARSTGDALMADHVWHAMRQDDVVPDVHCYNYYMEAKVWDGAYTGREKYHLRVTPFAYRKRSFDDPNLGWKGYGTARRSVRKDIMMILNEMTEEGTSGDEGTYVNVIMASSRVGSTETMKHVLKTVWNVDIDALAAPGDSSSLPRPKKYDRSSPLYPSSRLLFAVAHAFGTNNDIPGAMGAVSFISSSYDIPVPEEVWQELLERSFVLSRPRFGKDAQRNIKGKVPYEFLTALGQTMKSEPFNVQPTMEMYQLLAKTAWDQVKLPDFRQYMESAYAILEETRRKRRTARAIIENYLGPPQSEATASDTGRPCADPKLLLSRAFTEAVHTYDVLRMHTAQQTTIMERLAKLLLIHPRWVGRDNPVWERQLLPRVIEEWQDFLPKSVLLQIGSGDVYVHGETCWGDRLLNTHRRIPVRRPTVDNGLVLDEDARELDDDFFWACYPAELRRMNIPAVRRLFSGVTKRIANPVRRRPALEEAVEADAVNERAGAMPHALEAEYPSQRPLRWSADDEDIFDPTTNPLAVA
ncbi:uncharacterized protein NFIA_074650 [Aspergillus fischeri NRRL 181]|uniref:Mitochondrial ATPase expression-domain-containing protein n=1 Tax=Neosartorya fischeri (strain ATCC 1020 / DSM 3700 / CBS 544.65 / FGSC A1164 / JCM 1740 / NRRL 181 / WB 181) TaxID=331117 RepID=A1DDT8_NEOFI|nr:conserved hypothetical protein [Aspergillus fischeri NRRL 181]EAW17545.1 conserved hypothetical protein [Aspergillus fischeri NRRL 181]KAG2025478.1 hypothetical protein GB937_002732 [Aspergillus fischeri]